MFDVNSLPPELHFALSNAVPKRKAEFAAGRQAAKNALSQLGETACGVGRDAVGAPVWPPGITGSISHTEGFCAAVAARTGRLASIGLDCEQLGERLPTEILEMIAAPSERRAWLHLDKHLPLNWPIVTFAAKEALYKCLYPSVGRFFDFSAVVVSIDPEADGRHGSLRFVDAEDAVIADCDCSEIRGCFRIAGDLVLVGVEALRE